MACWASTAVAHSDGRTAAVMIAAVLTLPHLPQNSMMIWAGLLVPVVDSRLVGASRSRMSCYHSGYMCCWMLCIRYDVGHLHSWALLSACLQPGHSLNSVE